MDQSPGMLERCSSDLYDYLHTQDVQVAWDLLPGSSKLICSAGVWGYIEHFPGLYSNIVKTLVPGGYLIFSVKSDDWSKDAQKVRSSLAAFSLMSELPCNVSRQVYLPMHPDSHVSEGLIDIRI